MPRVTVAGCPFKSASEMLRSAERFFLERGGWKVYREKQNLPSTLSDREIISEYAPVFESRCVPNAWTLWAGFESYDAFRDLQFASRGWADAVAWIDNTLRMCAELALMQGDRKNNRGPEILVGTFWNYSAKQIVDMREGIATITTAAMQELVPEIPQHRRPEALERFKRAVYAARGSK